jgi:hypothetical protein
MHQSAYFKGSFDYFYKKIRLNMKEKIEVDFLKEIFNESIYINKSEIDIALASIQPAVEEPKAVALPTVVVESEKHVIHTPSIPTMSQLTKKQEALSLDIKGNYTNSVLIIQHESIQITEPHRELMRKILSACLLEPMACGYVKSSTPIDAKVILSHQPRIILTFGIPQDAFTPSLNKPYYQIQQYAGATLLAADSIKNIEANNALKKQLWACLKEMFGMA